MNELSKPLVFSPYYKSVIWGGDRIAPFKNEKIDCCRLGESWELSAVDGCESVVADGPLKGEKLSGLVARYGAALVGTKSAGRKFPLLVKFIDAKSDLSVQVHPDDELAAKRHNSLGKTEMWYVIDAVPGSHIYSGLCAPLTPDEYLRRIADNTIMQVVGAHDAKPGQFYYIPAGTIHAIGAGCLIAEIQQSSDITYRVYDYARVDANGQQRQLHTAEAKDAIDYTYPSVVTPTAEIYPGTKLDAVKSPFFSVDYVKLSAGEQMEIKHDGTTFTIAVVVAGEANIGGITVKAGHTALIPACAAATLLTGDATVLLAKV